MEDRWIIEMIIFLTTGLPLQQMSIDERKQLAVRSRNFCLLNFQPKLMQLEGATKTEFSSNLS